MSINGHFVPNLLQLHLADPSDLFEVLNRRIRSPGNNPPSKYLADPRKRHQLCFRRGIDVDPTCRRGGVIRITDNGCKSIRAIGVIIIPIDAELRPDRPMIRNRQHCGSVVVGKVVLIETVDTAYACVLGHVIGLEPYIVVRDWSS